MLERNDDRETAQYLDASPEPVPLPTAGCFVPFRHFPPKVSAIENKQEGATKIFGLTPVSERARTLDKITTKV
jgi:hypothetical protein